MDLSQHFLMAGAYARDNAAQFAAPPDGSPAPPSFPWTQAAGPHRFDPSMGVRGQGPPEGDPGGGGSTAPSFPWTQ